MARRKGGQDLKVNLGANNSNLKKVLAESQKAVLSFRDKLSGLTTKFSGVFSKLKTTISSVASPIFKLGSLIKNTFSSALDITMKYGKWIAGGFVAVLGLAVKQANDFEKSMKKLELVTKGNKKEIGDLLKLLEGGKLFSLAEQMEGISGGRALGLSVEQIKTIFPLLRDAGSVFNKSVSEAMTGIIRATQGEADVAESIGLRLSDRGVGQTLGIDPNSLASMDAETKKVKILQAAYIQLQKYKGGEAKMLQTFGGQLTRMKGLLSDAMGSFGKGFTERSGMTSGLQMMGNLLSKNMGIFIKFGYVVGNIFRNIMVWLGGWLNQLNKPGVFEGFVNTIYSGLQGVWSWIKYTYQVVSNVFSAIGTFLSAIWNETIKPIFSEWTGTNSESNFLLNLSEQLKQFSANNAIEFAQKLKEVIDKLIETLKWLNDSGYLKPLMMFLGGNYLTGGGLGNLTGSLLGSLGGKAIGGGLKIGGKAIGGTVKGLWGLGKGLVSGTGDLIANTSRGLKFGSNAIGTGEGLAARTGLKLGSSGVLSGLGRFMSSGMLLGELGWDAYKSQDEYFKAKNLKQEGFNAVSQAQYAEKRSQQQGWKNKLAEQAKQSLTISHLNVQGGDLLSQNINQQLAMVGNI